MIILFVALVTKLAIYIKGCKIRIIKVILHKTYHKGILWHTIGTKDSPEYKIFVPGSKGYKEAKKRVTEN